MREAEDVSATIEGRLSPVLGIDDKQINLGEVEKSKGYRIPEYEKLTHQRMG